MKKNITFLFISLFLLIACNNDEDNSAIPASPATTHASLNGGSVNLTWTVVEGTGITYNVYRSDSPVKLNAVPLTEAKFTDVLKTTGSFTYSITATLGGVESAKGIVSEKVILELPKTKTVQTIDKYYDTKYEYTYSYDTSNITKLMTISTKATTKNVKTQEVTITNSIAKYIYTGDLITKSMVYIDDNILKSSLEYMYNEQKKLIAGIRKKADGSISSTVTYTYNQDGTITETDDTPYSGPGIYTYEKGNYVKYQITTPMPDGDAYVAITDYVYDSKNESNINILGFNLFANFAKNNAISSSTIFNFNGVLQSTESSKSDCTYNENGYILTKMKNVMSSSGATIQTEKTVVTYY
ncbi:hypothetical protein GJU43_15160 [Flavobacterium sp. LC2016-23]|uniref:hypothetical protein n=1 Tax=Flavobacterium sp. LC2016-23 TaxID=2666330 RepID=UPI0012AFD997|nr:hypothetical protein [Flavobacterium sp. LC2016-23]MRX40624.1 hypothetical protein [Flavobacterium sp. LC2016-23]